MVSLRRLLAMALVPNVMAVRRGFGTDQAPVVTATHVVDKIGSLLETHLDKSQAKVRRTMHAVHLSTQSSREEITPELRPALNEALDKVIAGIVTNVDPEIIQQHLNTQERLDKKVTSLVKNKERVLALFDNAKDKDLKWFGCVEKERELLVELETKKSEFEAAKVLKNQKKVSAEDTRKFVHSAESYPWSTAFECDPSKDEKCEAALGVLSNKVDTFLQTVDAQIDAATNTNADAEQAYESAKQAVNTAKISRTDAEATWATKADLCNDKLAVRNEKMCKFGYKVQKQCRKKLLFDDFLYEIDRTDGGAWSHPDRVEQWRAASVTKCMLQKVKSDFQINSDTMTECDKAVNYDIDVGVLARTPTEVTQAVTFDNYNCDSTSITFSGRTWKVPEGAHISSEDYNNTDSSPSASLKWDTYPFEFCNDIADTCATHICEDESVSDKTFICNKGACSDRLCCREFSLPKQRCGSHTCELGNPLDVQTICPNEGCDDEVCNCPV